MALVLALLGVLVIMRTVMRRSVAVRVYSPRWRTMGPLGLVGGFVDSIGGGGWGPVTTSSLMAANRMAPNQVIGTVSTAETIVALSASAGFLFALGSQGIAWGAMVALLVGGIIAAPIAAWMVSRLDHRVLGALVGGMIFFYNAEGVLVLLRGNADHLMLGRAAIVIMTLAITVLAWRTRQRPSAEAELPSGVVPDATPAEESTGHLAPSRVRLSVDA